MAIVKASYATAPHAAKATIRYITHRPNRQGQRQSRHLFDDRSGTGRLQAYSLIDAARRGERFYHLKISPSQQEDCHGDLHLRAIAEETIRAMADCSAQPVRWVGVVHADHSALRHVHVLAIVGTRLDREALRAGREGATRECQQQQLELDAYRAAEQERVWEEEIAWDYWSP